ncbi:MAG TPA: hypothetical protein VET65_08535 [Candidatus Limnocylindrales bacterium]|nr:hypothetical protein [Candidatus Limnocylindrales bacterium]
MPTGQRGQIGVAVGLAVAATFAIAVSSLQLIGLGLTALEVQHVAQTAADVAVQNPITPTPERPACWTVANGFQNPAAYSGTPVCRAIAENLGTIEAARAAVDITRFDAQVHVTITYRAPISSPLLRLLLGDTFTTTQDAWSR